jgi:hypothetical protein
MMTIAADPRRLRGWAVGLVVLLGGVLTAGSAPAFDVTQCGQTVPAGETGVLQNDLTCAQAGGRRRQNCAHR